MNFMSVIVKNIHTSYIKVNRFCCLAGNTWTTNHCSDDRALDAGVSLMGTVSSPTLLREVNKQTSNPPTQKLTLFIHKLNTLHDRRRAEITPNFAINLVMPY
jgi:hypothetical protein